MSDRGTPLEAATKAIRESFYADNYRPSHGDAVNTARACLTAAVNALTAGAIEEIEWADTEDEAKAKLLRALIGETP
jgi:hypothetical protein